LAREKNPNSIGKMVEYAIWRGIIARCENQNVKAFAIYGGRGVKICDAWRRDFSAFLEHVGLRPTPKHSIDRIDYDGNYEPGNVRWARPEVQANNRRNTRFVVYRGTRMALANAVRAAGSVVHIECAWIRIKTGWPVEKALETPRLFLSGNSNERRMGAAHA
jgi:hypothetical protein